MNIETIGGDFPQEKNEIKTKESVLDAEKNSELEYEFPGSLEGVFLELIEANNEKTLENNSPEGTELKDKFRDILNLAKEEIADGRASRKKLNEMAYRLARRAGFIDLPREYIQGILDLGKAFDNFEKNPQKQEKIIENVSLRESVVERPVEDIRLAEDDIVKNLPIENKFENSEELKKYEQSVVNSGENLIKTYLELVDQLLSESSGFIETKIMIGKLESKIFAQYNKYSEAKNNYHGYLDKHNEAFVLMFEQEGIVDDVITKVKDLGKISDLVLMQREKEEKAKQKNGFWSKTWSKIKNSFGVKNEENRIDQIKSFLQEDKEFLKRSLEILEESKGFSLRQVA